VEEGMQEGGWQEGAGKGEEATSRKRVRVRFRV
jgi:hypothetical protein